jgi:hypothetical protein
MMSLDRFNRCHFLPRVYWLSSRLNVFIGMWHPKLFPNLLALSLCLGRFSKTFQFPCWFFLSVIYEEIKYHCFPAIIVFGFRTHHMSDGLKVQPDLYQRFSRMLKVTNKFLSILSITYIILCFEELLEMNAIKLFSHSTTHSDFWSISSYNNELLHWAIEKALAKAVFATNPQEKVKSFEFLSRYIWSMFRMKEIFEQLLHHSVSLCEDFHLWLWLKMWTWSSDLPYRLLTVL